MSSASRSKSEGKTAKAAKEQQKASLKSTTAPANFASNIPERTSNAVSGTFHTLKSVLAASSPPSQSSRRFSTIYEMGGHFGSFLGTGPEDDSVSNSDSCSGESEDRKEKAIVISPLVYGIPGSNNDKRDRIRQKNERKHQRKRERWAHELHERCNGYLMSRKLEALVQQLVAMGFSYERAKIALIQNEGLVEESVTWLFEGGEDLEEKKDVNVETSRIKVNIDEELARITAMEIQYKFKKQEVERIVVDCEGDLEKADGILRSQREELAASPPKPEENGDPQAMIGGQLSAPATQISIKAQMETVALVTIPQRREQRDFNYSKEVAPEVASSLESGVSFLQSLRRIQPKPEWVKPLAAKLPEKKWASLSTSPVSCSLACPLQISPSKMEAQYAFVGGNAKYQQTCALREPVVLLQRPQSVNLKQNPVERCLGAAPPVTTGWYSNGTSVDCTNGSRAFMHLQSTRLSTRNPCAQFRHNHQYQHTIGSSSLDSVATRCGGSWSAMGTSPSLPASPSLGLFTGWSSTGSSCPSSPVDWNMGESMPQCDYTSIDWSMESSPRQNDFWPRFDSHIQNKRYDGRSFDTATGTESSWMIMDDLYHLGNERRAPRDASSSAGLGEWTSPFAGRDLFSLSRQSVISLSR